MVVLRCPHIPTFLEDLAELVRHGRHQQMGRLFRLQVTSRHLQTRRFGAECWKRQKRSCRGYRCGLEEVWNRREMVGGEGRTGEIARKGPANAHQVVEANSFDLEVLSEAHLESRNQV